MAHRGDVEDCMRILCIRHGQTTGDVEDRYGGDYDDHLSSEGQQQTAALALELRDKGIEVVYTSPLIRARETADGVARGMCPIEVVPDLKERNRYGVLTGLQKSEAQARYPELVQKVADRHATIDGAESYEDFQLRIRRAFDAVVSHRAREVVAVAWHGGPMVVLFEDILKEGTVEYGDCGWVEIEKVGDTFSIVDSRRMDFHGDIT